MVKEIYEVLCKISGTDHVLQQEPMSRHTTFRTGGPAELLVMPSAEELPEIIRYCGKKQIPYLVIGNGSNLLAGDTGVEGVVIEIGKRMSEITVDKTTVTAGAGALLSAIASKAAAEGHRRAILALDVFIYRIQKYIGAYAAALGGVDTLVFTAGIGENDAKMRKDILTGMEWLGIQLDDEANQQRGEHKISAPDSKVEVWVIPTNEELVIARETVRLAKQAKA